MPEPSSAAVPRFHSLADAAFHGRLAQHPVEATSLGFHDHDDRFGATDPASTAAREAFLRKYLFRIAAVEPGALGEADRVDATLLEGRFRADLLVLPESLGNPLRLRESISEGVMFLLLPDARSADWRLAALAGRFDRVPELLRAAQSSIPGLPKAMAELAVEEFRGLADFLKKGISGRIPQSGDPGLRRRMEESKARAVESIDAFAAWLANRSAEAGPGIGAEALAARLRALDGIDLPPGELLEAERAAMKAYRRELSGKAPEVSPGRGDDPDAFRRFARLLPGVEVLPAPAFETSRARLTLRTSGPFEEIPGRPVLTVSLEGTTGADVDCAAEGIRASLELAGSRRAAASPIRKAFAPRSTIDGWALYGELRAVEEGKDALRRSRLERALAASARAAAAIKIHAEAASFEEAVAFLSGEAGLSAPEARFEARRALGDPAVLLASWGLRELLALRADWRARTGGTARDFDAAFLALAAPPLPLARRLLLGSP